MLYETVETFKRICAGLPLCWSSCPASQTIQDAQKRVSDWKGANVFDPFLKSITLVVDITLLLWGRRVWCLTRKPFLLCEREEVLILNEDMTSRCGVDGRWCCLTWADTFTSQSELATWHSSFWGLLRGLHSRVRRPAKYSEIELDCESETETMQSYP